MAIKHGPPSDGGEATSREKKDQASEPHRTHAMDHFESTGRRIAVCLAHRNYDLARDALEAAISVLQQLDKKPPFWDTILSDIGVDMKTANALEESLDVLTIGDFLQHRPEEIVGIRNVGTVSFISLIQKVMLHSLKYIPD